jgi:DNA-binding response OmpR family regulator
MPNKPVITAFSNDEGRPRARNAGVICYLAKPFKDEKLLACVRSALQSRDARQDTGRES